MILNGKGSSNLCGLHGYNLFLFFFFYRSIVRNNILFLCMYNSMQHTHTHTHTHTRTHTHTHTHTHTTTYLHVMDCNYCHHQVGTSSVVYPAAGYATMLAMMGVPVAEFNLEPTPVTSALKYVIHCQVRGQSGLLLMVVSRRWLPIASICIALGRCGLASRMHPFALSWADVG